MALRTPRAWLLTCPRLSPVLPSIPSPAQAGSGLFPSLPPGASGSFWELLGTVPKGQPSDPALFVSQLVSPELLGPWDAPGPSQASSSTRACARLWWAQGLPLPRAANGAGDPRDQNTPSCPSLCASPAQAGAQGAGGFLSPLKGARAVVVPAATRQGFGFCPITVLWVSQLCAKGWEPGSGAREEEEDEGSSSPGEVLATGSLLAPLTPPPAQGAKQCKG